MILVAVGDKKTPDPLRILPEVSDIRYHKVDARHIVVRKHGTHVHHDDVFTAFKRGHVLADLAQAAQWNDSEHALVTGALHIIIMLSRHSILLSYSMQRSISHGFRHDGHVKPVTSTDKYST